MISYTKFCMVLILVFFVFLLCEIWKKSQPKIYTEHEKTIACKLVREAQFDTVSATSYDDPVEQFYLVMQSVSKIAIARKIIANDELLYHWTKINLNVLNEYNEMCKMNLLSILKKKAAIDNNNNTC